MKRGVVVTQRDLTIGRCTLAAILLWVLGIGLGVYITVVGPSVVHATWAVICVAAAATITVRCFLVQQTEMMRNAYLIGRDAREEGLVQLIPPQRSAH
jgi:hypothetical protein